MPHCEAPVVDGRCPFDRAALPEPGDALPTPATHFAFSAAPDAATALLLPFAEHPWHSRVVAALREDAALSTADDDGAEFVLVSLPERLRPSVRDALAELLDLRAHDRRVHCGISCVYPGEYTAVLTSMFKLAREVVPIEAKERNLDDVAAVCQLCRAGEVLQCFTITDVACELASSLEHARNEDSKHPRLELQSRSDADMERPARSVAEKFDSSSFTFARHPELDPTFLSAMQSTECSFGLLGRIARAIPDVVLDYIPPCALPHSVVETQLPCWLKTESSSQRQGDYCYVYHNMVFPACKPAKYILYVATETPAQDRRRGTLYFNTWDLLRPHLPFKADGIVLPLGIPDYAPVFASALFSSATNITFPSDFHDEHWGGFTRLTCEKVEQLDFSQTQVTTIPAACYRRPELARVTLPPTLRTIHDGAFSCCPKLQEVTGLHRGVTIEPTAFAFSHALPVSTFKDLPAAPSPVRPEEMSAERLMFRQFFS